MATKPPELGRNLLDTSQAAALLMLSRQRLFQLQKEGWIERTGRGQYPLAPLVRGYARFLQRDSARQAETQSANRLREVRTRALEAKLQRQEAGLIDSTETAELAAVLQERFLATLDALPAAIAGGDQAKRERVDGIVERAKAGLTRDFKRIVVRAMGHYSVE